jgi:hypothetical protein
MKYTPTILALSLLLTACSRHDAEFTKQIPGTWKQELRTYTNTLTIVPNGSFSFSRFTTNDQDTFTNTGTWRIRGGGIVMTATKQIGAHPLPLGDFFKAKIIHLDDHLWVFKMDDGITNSFIR